MHYRLLHPSNYLGAHDLAGRDVTVEIESIEHKHELTMEGGRKDVKPLVRFRGAKKGMVLNKTNSKAIARLHGHETDAWIGKKITLYADKTKCNKEIVDCVRIRGSAAAGA